MSFPNHPFTISLLFSHSNSSLLISSHLLAAELINWLLGTLSLGCLLFAAFTWCRPSLKCGSPSPRSSPPVIPTWPWVGSLFAYTRDPVGFISRNHARYGDVFTTIILGHRCTFIRSAPHVRQFAAAPRTILDVTGAYKLIASGVIGEEAFIGPTRNLTRLVFAPDRLDSLDSRLWALAEDMIGSRLEPGVETWTKLTPSGWLDHVVFGLDLAALLGPCPPELLPPVARHFRVLDADLTLLGLFTSGGARARAKDELISLLRKHVQTHLELAAQRSGCVPSLPDPELPEVLLCSDLELKSGGEADKLLRAYHTGTATLEMVKKIEQSVSFIALFIYGYVWAGQTNSAAATIGALYDILHYVQRTGDDLVGEIRAELEQAGGLGVASYRNTSCLTRCVNETLRLRATGAWVRLTKDPFQLTDGSTCPSGFVVASPTPISFDTGIYAQPHEWDPSRYLRPPFASGEIPLDSRTLLPSPSRFPNWGIGHAHCPGQHLAYKMISITLLTFFQHFEVRLAPSDLHNKPPVFQDVAAAGLQRLKSGFSVEIKKR